MELVLDTLMVGVVLCKYFVHFLAVGMLLRGLDGLGILGLDSLNSVVIIFQRGNHFSYRLNILNKLIINTFIMLLIDIVIVWADLIIEILIGHGLVGHVEVLRIEWGGTFLS